MFTLNGPVMDHYLSYGSLHDFVTKLPVYFFFLGFAIFSEALPPLWWLGAAMLVAGNVIIGRQDEGTKPGDETLDENSAGYPESSGEDGQGSYRPVPHSEQTLAGIKEDEDEDILDLELEEIQSN